jgi:hypothetical protein
MENIIEMPVEYLSDQDVVDLFKGLIRLVKRQYQARIDALLEEVKELKLLQQPAH